MVRAVQRSIDHKLGPQLHYCSATHLYVAGFPFSFFSSAGVRPFSFSIPFVTCNRAQEHSAQPSHL